MKIGILTFHKAYNYGAFMQCYTLSTSLEKMLPNCTVEVINYSSRNMILDYKKSLFKKILGDKRTNGSRPLLIIAKRLVKTVLDYKKNICRKKYDERIMKEFEKAWELLPIKREALISDNPTEFLSYIEKGKYDIIIVGSDAIWNDNQTSKPNMYLLHDIKNCIKLSYAASTYGMDFDNHSQEELDYVNESLSEFHFVGVRDSVTAQYVTKCTKGLINGKYTCDPSLILDMDSLPVSIDKLKEKLTNKGIDLAKPTIGLMCSSWLAKIIRNKLGDEFQYISIYHYNGYEDYFLDDLNPFEWSKIFSLFDATFTHYFHGTMFSLKNGTLTFSIEKKTDYNQKYITKIQDALKKMELYNDVYYELESIDDIEWENIKEKIKHNDKKDTNNLYKEAINKQIDSFSRFFINLKEICENGTKKGA